MAEKHIAQEVRDLREDVNKLLAFLPVLQSEFAGRIAGDTVDPEGSGLETLANASEDDVKKALNLPEALPGDGEGSLAK